MDTSTFLDSISVVLAMKDVLNVEMKLSRTAEDAIPDISYGKEQLV